MSGHGDPIGGRLLLRNDKIPLRNDLSIGRFGMGRLYFDYPNDLAIDKDRNIYILDSKNRRVQVMDEDGKFKAEWDWKSIGKGLLDDPVAIAISPKDETVFLLDGESARAFQFDQKGRYLLDFGRYGLAKASLREPVDLTVDTRGTVYVLDRKRGKVVKWHSKGEFVSEWGRLGTQPGEFDDPVSIAYLDELLGFIYVLDMGKGALVKFDRQGILKETIDLKVVIEQIGNSFGKVDVNRKGDIFVLEGAQGKLIKFTLREVSIFALGDIQEPLRWLGGLAVDDRGRVYVTDLRRHKVMRYLADLE